MAESDGVPPGRQTSGTGTGKRVGVFDRPARRGFPGPVIAIIVIAIVIAIALALYFSR